MRPEPPPAARLLSVPTVTLEPSSRLFPFGPHVLPPVAPPPPYPAIVWGASTSPPPPLPRRAVAEGGGTLGPHLSQLPKLPTYDEIVSRQQDGEQGNDNDEHDNGHDEHGHGHDDDGGDARHMPMPMPMMSMPTSYILPSFAAHYLHPSAAHHGDAHAFDRGFAPSEDESDNTPQPPQAPQLPQLPQPTLPPIQLLPPLPQPQPAPAAPAPPRKRAAVKRPPRLQVPVVAAEVHPPSLPRQRSRPSNLPADAVRVLLAWFMAHRENPYPSSAQKQRLAEQANISEKKVSNWFINARNRFDKMKFIALRDAKPQRPRTSPRQRTTDGTAADVGPAESAPAPVPEPGPGPSPAQQAALRHNLFDYCGDDVLAGAIIAGLDLINTSKPVPSEVARTFTHVVQQVYAAPVPGSSTATCSSAKGRQPAVAPAPAQSQQPQQARLAQLPAAEGPPSHGKRKRGRPPHISYDEPEVSRPRTDQPFMRNDRTMRALVDSGMYRTLNP